MSWISRRRVLAATSMSIMSGGLRRLWGGEAADDSRVDKAQKEGKNEPLALVNYEPASMLHLPETHVARARYPVIDFHTHMLDQELREICTSRNAITGFGKKQAPPSANLKRFLDPELQIADMDERGIDMHVVFTGPVHMSAWWADPQTALTLTGRMNDIIAGWVARYPTRFVGTVTLPMQDVELSIGELKRHYQAQAWAADQCGRRLSRDRVLPLGAIGVVFIRRNSAIPGITSSRSEFDRPADRGQVAASKIGLLDAVGLRS